MTRLPCPSVPRRCEQPAQHLLQLARDAAHAAPRPACPVFTRIGRIDFGFRGSYDSHNSRGKVVSSEALQPLRQSSFAREQRGAGTIADREADGDAPRFNRGDDHRAGLVHPRRERNAHELGRDAGQKVPEGGGTTVAAAAPIVPYAPHERAQRVERAELARTIAHDAPTACVEKHRHSEANRRYACGGAQLFECGRGLWWRAPRRERQRRVVAARRRSRGRRFRLAASSRHCSDEIDRDDTHCAQVLAHVVSHGTLRVADRLDERVERHEKESAAVAQQQLHRNGIGAEQRKQIIRRPSLVGGVAATETLDSDGHGGEQISGFGGSH